MNPAQTACGGQAWVWWMNLTANGSRSGGGMGATSLPTGYREADPLEPFSHWVSHWLRGINRIKSTSTLSTLELELWLLSRSFLMSEE